MKRTALLALPIAAVVLAGCGGNGEDDATTNAPPAPNATVGESPAPGVADRTSGQEPINADQADVEVTTCNPTSTGVEMVVDVTNTTDEPRTYILTGVAYDGDRNPVASAAVMVDRVEPGETGEGNGKSTGAVEGEVTCEVTQIESMPM